MGGGVTLVYILLYYSCSFLSGTLAFNCIYLFGVISPIFPVAWVLAEGGDIFGYSWTVTEFYAPVISPLFWFGVGAIYGVLVDRLNKGKLWAQIKKSPQ